MHISAAVLCRPSTSVCNALAEPHRTVYPSATVILIGPDMCEHPLGSGHSENGSDCCRVFGESPSDTFAVQNVALQNWSSSDFVLIPCSKPARIHASVFRFKKASFEQPGALLIDVGTFPGSESTPPPPPRLSCFLYSHLSLLYFVLNSPDSWHRVV